MLDGPLVRLHVESRKIGEHHPGNLGVLWVLGLGALEERLQGQEGRLNGQNRGPGVAEGVEADGSLYD